MSVEPHPTHQGWWRIRYYPNGRKGKEEIIVLKDGYTWEEAKEWELRARREARGGATLETFPTIEQALPHYIEYYKLDHIAPGPVVRYLDTLWRPAIGKLKFGAINAAVIERYKHARLRAGIKPTTINKELSAMSGFLKWAKKKGYCHAVEVERFPEKMCKAPLPDVPTREEVLALIDGMIWPKCGLFACLYYGGLRKSEATMLRVEDVYLDRSIMIVLGKGNKQRVVPVVDDLRPWLVKRLSEVDTGYLWTTRGGLPITDLKKIIKLAKQRVGLRRHIYPHLLRHAFGTHATMAGVNLRTLQNVMGHTTSKTTEIYTTLSNEAIIEEVRGKFGKFRPVRN